MLDILLTVLFCWLVFKVLGLLFRVAWGVTKLVATLLLILALPLLGVCLMFAGGLLLLVPLAVIGLALLLLKSVI